MGNPVFSASGTMGAVGKDGSLTPNAFVAVTLQVYATPFVRPDTTMRLVVLDPV